MNKNHLVKKDNNLVFARYKLSELSIKVLSTVVSMIRKDDKDFETYSLSIADFKELLGTKHKDMYAEVQTIAQELMSKPMKIPQDKGGFLVVNWIASLRYEPNSGVIDFKIAPDLKPYLIELSGGFLKYELKNILALKSPYVIRLYELLKHEYNKVNNYTGNKVVSYEIELEELRNLFEIPISYAYKDVRIRILDKAVKQFSEKTDITMKYQEHKRGRKVHKVEFTIRENTGQDTYLQDRKDFIKYMRTHHVNQDIQETQGMVLSISDKGRIYNKKTLREYAKKDSDTVWSLWFKMAQEDKLLVLKQGTLF
jgi:plasmid replication initiation protein